MVIAIVDGALEWFSKYLVMVKKTAGINDQKHIGHYLNNSTIKITRNT